MDDRIELISLAFNSTWWIDTESFISATS